MLRSGCCDEVEQGGQRRADALRRAFAPQGSTKGECRVLDYHRECSSSDVAQPRTISWAATDYLLHDDDYAKYPDVQMYPTVAAAVVPVYRLPVSTPGYSPLRLTNFLLAQIFRGRIKTWGHPLLVNLNPWLANLEVPNATIELVVRADASGSTFLMKQFLHDVDPNFEAELSVDHLPDWGNLTVTKKSTNFGVLAYVMTTSYTLSYSTLTDAIQAGVPRSLFLKPSGGVVESNTYTIESALAELGLGFDRKGEPEVRLTADLHDAQGLYAWPIVGYTYVLIRKETTRFDLGETCEMRKEMVRFFEWFHTAPAVSDIAREDGYSPLPLAVRELVLRRMLEDIKCNGSYAYTPLVAPTLHFQGSSLMDSPLKHVSIEYKAVDSSVRVAFTSKRANSTIVQDLASSTLTTIGGYAAALVPEKETLPLENMLYIPFAGVATRAYL